MTREDIDNNISIICPNDDDFEKPIISPAYLKNELEALALEQEPCKDTISRQAYIERYRKWAYSEYGRKTDNEALAIRVAMSLPPVTSRPKIGHWIEERMYMECPNCRDIWHYEENQTERFKFCPTCGERMK